MRERRLARRAYGILLGLYPRAFREEWRGAMEDAFDQRWSEARARGGARAAWLFLREASGAVMAGLSERVRTRRRRSRGGWAGGIATEFRQAMRRLGRAPGFTIATVLTLSIALGANVTLFTLLRGVVLKPLPYPGADRLVQLDHSAPGLGFERGVGLSEAMYVQYSTGTRVLESIAIWQARGVAVRVGEQAERMRATRTTHTIPAVLRVSPLLGRWFDAVEDSPNGTGVAVLGHAVWQRDFGGDPGVLGRVVTIDGTPAEIIGVMPASFAFPDARTELWVPARIDAAAPRVGGLNYEGVGRLRPGARMADVRSDLNALLSALPEAYPGSEAAVSLVNSAGLASVALPRQDYVVGDVGRTLWVLLGAAFLVLLAACANVANLFLVRADARQREVAVRRALGAGGRSLSAFIVSESAILCGVSILAAVALAAAGIRLLADHGPGSVPRLDELRLDGGVLLFAGLLGVLSTALFGSLPMAGRGQARLGELLSQGGRTNTATRMRMRARNVLMGTQVALTLVLTVASLLLGRSFLALSSVDPGFDADDALVFELDVPARDGVTGARTALMHQELLARIAALPGVRRASATTCMPFEGTCWGDPILVEGAVKRADEVPPVVGMRRVAAGYFDAIGMRLVAGRVLTSADEGASGRAVVINRALAAAYFPGSDAIGRRLYPDWGAVDPDWYTVVGVVDNVVTYSARAERRSELYFALTDHAEIGPPIGRMTYAVRSAADPVALAASIRTVVRDVDADIAVARTRTLASVVSESNAQTAFITLLLGLAACVSLILGVIGIYGVISWAVGRRTRELGLRFALGARSADVYGMVMRQGGQVTLIGLAAGGLLALAGGNIMKTMLYGIAPRDPLTFGVASLLLLSVALLACWVPARRAAHLDPVEALRAE